MFRTAPIFCAMSEQKRIRIKKNVLLLPDEEAQVNQRWREMEFGTSYSEALRDLIKRGLDDWTREKADQSNAA
jgi:hypothetical protein